jgi:carbamoyl-phosphate synthase large subunit
MNKKQTILLLGSGAIKIGEAGEFDYSGTQAIKALKEAGKRVVLVNPNVATIQTSAGLADEVYFLPVTGQFVSKVIEKERPDGIILSFGGQTALNCGLSLADSGVLEKFGVRVLGTPIETIRATEDRELFAERLKRINLKTAHGGIVKSVSDGLVLAAGIGYPVMIRAGFALGGAGSGIAETEEELTELLTKALATTGQVIVEECLWGWKELEYEVVRDSADNCMVVCNMENFDPVGIHTGESIVIAPSQTLTNDEYFFLRQSAIDAIRELGVVGECNIQFALHPKKHEVRVIEVNARLSRSSALASKATGYPIAYIAAKLALGVTLPELGNAVTGKTSAFFEPALDYIVVKIPRWDLDKYRNVAPAIGSEMKSVGEVMSIGRSFEEAIQKAARMLNDGYLGVIDPGFGNESKEALLEKIKRPDSMRLFSVCSALRAGATVSEIAELTGIDAWFLSKLESIVSVYSRLADKKPLSQALLRTSKRSGFSDAQIAAIRGRTEHEIMSIRKKQGITPFVKRIDTMAGEFPAVTNYLYMTYNADSHDRVPLEGEDKVIVIGCGPYAVGTSVEFDWCAVNAATAVREAGKKAVIINCNPETVSTDYDMSDYLYFEELTLERVTDIHAIEQAPVVVSVGGQVPNNLAPKIAALGIPILGTTAEDILRAEDRKQFSELLDSISVQQPEWMEARSFKEATSFSARVGYPVLVRPSFVLSGKGMRVIETDDEFGEYLDGLPKALREHPLVISKYIHGAKECDVDGVAQSGTVLVSAISEHVEHGGVHSGDAAMVLPPHTLTRKVQEEIREKTASIVRALGVSGPFNIQYLYGKGNLFVIECNLRASRSFPFVSKVTGTNFITLSTQVFLGIQDVDQSDRFPEPPFTAVKVPQFSYHKLRGADPVTGVEMNSTGEVMGLGRNPYDAYLSGILATGVNYPDRKAAFISLGGLDGKLRFFRYVRRLAEAGFTLYASSGTGLFLRENGIDARTVGKIHEGIHPNVSDLMGSKAIDFAVVTPETSSKVPRRRIRAGMTDGYIMRRMAIDLGIPVFTNPDSGAFFVESVLRMKPDAIPVQSWQAYRVQGNGAKEETV